MVGGTDLTRGGRVRYGLDGMTRVALVALFAFNFFSHRKAEIMDEMERLGTRLIDHIRLDAKGAGDEAA